MLLPCRRLNAASCRAESRPFRVVVTGTLKPGLPLMALSNGFKPRTGPTNKVGNLYGVSQLPKNSVPKVLLFTPTALLREAQAEARMNGSPSGPTAFSIWKKALKSLLNFNRPRNPMFDVPDVIRNRGGRLSPV